MFDTLYLENYDCNENFDKEAAEARLFDEDKRTYLEDGRIEDFFDPEEALLQEEFEEELGAADIDFEFWGKF